MDQSRIAVFGDCKATAPTTQPPWLVDRSSTAVSIPGLSIFSSNLSDALEFVLRMLKVSTRETSIMKNFFLLFSEFKQDLYVCIDGSCAVCRVSLSYSFILSK